MKPGDRIGAEERYLVEEQLGEGGMGTVWKAFDEELGRSVAIKVLHGRQHGHAEAQARLAREARILAALDHPHLLGIYDAHFGDEPSFLVLELLRGRPLSQVLSEGPCGERECRRILGEVGSAVAYLHERSILHRDLKPENVFLTDEGSCKLMDFGLARPDDVTPLTLEGALLGTLWYAAPEIFQGRRADSRSDVYQLGILGAMLATGKHLYPLPRESKAFFDFMMRGDWPTPACPAGVSTSFWAYLLRLGARRPEDRPCHGGEALDELKALPSSKVSSSKAVPSPSSEGRPSDTARRPAIVIHGPDDERREGMRRALAGTLSLLALLSVLWTFFGGPSPPTRPPQAKQGVRSVGPAPSLHVTTPARFSLRWDDSQSAHGAELELELSTLPSSPLRFRVAYLPRSGKEGSTEAVIAPSSLRRTRERVRLQANLPLPAAREGRFSRLSWTLSTPASCLASDSLETVKLHCLTTAAPRSQRAMAEEILDGVLIDPTADNHLRGRIVLEGDRIYALDESDRIYAMERHDGSWQHGWIWASPCPVVHLVARKGSLFCLRHADRNWQLLRLNHATCRDAFQRACGKLGSSSEAILAHLREPAVAPPVPLPLAEAREKLRLLLARPESLFPSETLLRGEDPLQHGRLLFLSGHERPSLLLSLPGRIELRSGDGPAPPLLRLDDWTLAPDGLEAPPLADRHLLLDLRRSDRSGLALLDLTNPRLRVMLELPLPCRAACGGVLLDERTTPVLLVPVLGPDTASWEGPNGLCRFRLDRTSPLDLRRTDWKETLLPGEAFLPLQGRGERLWAHEGSLLFPQVMRVRDEEGRPRLYGRRLAVLRVKPDLSGLLGEIYAHDFVNNKTPPDMSLLADGVLHVSAGPHFVALAPDGPGRCYWHLPYYRRPRRPFAFAGPGGAGETFLPEANGLLILPRLHR